MANWLFENSGSLSLGSSATSYLPLSGALRSNTAEVRSQALARASYTFQNLLVYVVSNTSPNATTFRSRKNTANGAQSISIGASTTGTFEDTTNSDSLVDGDKFNYQYVTGASEACTINKVSSLLVDAGTNPPQIAGDPAPATNAKGTTWNMALEGVPAANATEALAQDKYTTQATMTNLRVYIATNSINGTTTGTLRVNGGNGVNVVSIASTTTGAFEDVTHTDTLSASDLVNVQFVAAGTTGTMVVQALSALNASAGRRMQSSFKIAGTTQAFGQTAQYHLQGGTAGTPEADAQLKCRAALVFKNLWFYTPTNTVNGTSTLTLRQNAADSALTLSVASSTTGGFNDVSNSVTTVAADLMNWQLVTGGASGTMTLQTIGVEQSNPAGGPPPVMSSLAMIGVGQ